jgi:hypothetical protein
VPVNAEHFSLLSYAPSGVAVELILSLLHQADQIMSDASFCLLALPHFHEVWLAKARSEGVLMAQDLQLAANEHRNYRSLAPFWLHQLVIDQLCLMVEGTVLQYLTQIDAPPIFNILDNLYFTRSYDVEGARTSPLSKEIRVLGEISHYHRLNELDQRGLLELREQGYLPQEIDFLVKIATLHFPDHLLKDVVFDIDYSAIHETPHRLGSRLDFLCMFDLSENVSRPDYSFFGAEVNLLHLGLVEFEYRTLLC